MCLYMCIYILCVNIFICREGTLKVKECYIKINFKNKCMLKHQKDCFFYRDSLKLEINGKKRD